MGKRLHCGVCHEVLKDDDLCFMDDFNTVTHQGCYSLETNLPIKDLGTYRSIIEQYDFFQELLDEN